MAYKKRTNNPKMGRPKTVNRTETISIRVSVDEKKMIQDCAKLNHQSNTDVIIEALNQYFAQTIKNKVDRPENPANSKEKS